MIPKKVINEIAFLAQQNYKIEYITIDQSKYEECADDLKPYSVKKATLGNFSFIITYKDGERKKNVFLT